jgi:fused signal recognition particle receptor
MARDRVTEGKRVGFWGRLKRLALSDVGALISKLKAEDIEALERLMLEADFGLPATAEIVDALEAGVRKGSLKTESDLRRFVEQHLANLLGGDAVPPALVVASSGPTIVLVVGVNGSGKTTSIAKLAHHLRREGHSVLLAAADTYRAGAVAQLAVWAERLDVPCVTGVAGGDPAAVAFDAVEAGKARGIDYVLVDTAGRLHTQEGLMEELRKVARVVGRQIPDAPHETLLVLDGTVGQNAVQQGRLFTTAVTITGLIVTKLDGTARGGALVALRRELQIPIRFVGRGESLDDLEPFDPTGFAHELLSED